MYRKKKRPIDINAGNYIGDWMRCRDLLAAKATLSGVTPLGPVAAATGHDHPVFLLA